jgi:hypothetical protein
LESLLSSLDDEKLKYLAMVLDFYDLDFELLASSS